jgi:hypothetical protein
MASLPDELPTLLRFPMKPSRFARTLPVSPRAGLRLASYNPTSGQLQQG